jgi:tetratricopeptide (TPR) repeat protein
MSVYNREESISMSLLQQSDDKKHSELAKIADRHHDSGIDLCYVHHDHDKALVELRKAAALRESIVGKYQNDTALSYFRIASILREQKKDFLGSLIVARREFRISKVLSGNDGISTIASDEDWLLERVQWIRAVFKDSPKLVEPEGLKYCTQLLQSIEFERRGDTHSASNEWELAITQYNCALALESSAYARNLLDIADLHVKIGDCLVQRHDYDAALEEFRNAYVKYKGEYGGDLHATLLTVLKKNASIYLKQRKYDAALASYCKAYFICEEIFGELHSVSIETLQDIRLVTVKEMEDLRLQERRRMRDAKREGKSKNNGHKKT